MAAGIFFAYTFPFKTFYFPSFDPKPYLYCVQTPILSIHQLTKTYEVENSGVNDINFSVSAGEIVAIIGESGSGKSTLLKCMFGLLAPNSGEVLFEGRRVKGPDEQLVPGHPSMRMVSQDFSLNIYASVYDNIASMLSNTNVSEKQQKTTEIMERLHIEHLRHRKAINLSGGEQQRVAIARAMVAGIQVLLLDEPFSQVDTILKSELRADLKKISAETGLTIILVSHDPTDGLFLADRVLVLQGGALIQTGTPEEVYNYPRTIYAAKLMGNANVLSAADAKLIHLPASDNWVVFYPEWVQLTSGWKSRTYRVVDVYFKGFFEELVLARKGVIIRVIHTKCGVYKKNDSVQVNISRFLMMENGE